MRIPNWLYFLVAAWVLLFGAFRIYLAFRSRSEEQRAKQGGGMFALPRRTHFLFGLVYLIAGVFLVLAGLGVRLGLGK